jgi:hypothetical protein
VGDKLVNSGAAESILGIDDGTHIAIVATLDFCGVDADPNSAGARLTAHANRGCAPRSGGMTSRYVRLHSVGANLPLGEFSSWVVEISAALLAQ